MATDTGSQDADPAEHRVLIQLFGALKETVQNHNDGPNGGRLSGAFADAVSILAGRTAQCAQCGDCCQRLHFRHTYLELQALSVQPGTDFAFVKAHWRPAAGEPLGTHYFACDAYDSDSHLCTAHEERTRDLPWLPLVRTRAHRWDRRAALDRHTLLVLARHPARSVAGGDRTAPESAAHGLRWCVTRVISCRGASGSQ